MFFLIFLYCYYHCRGCFCVTVVVGGIVVGDVGVGGVGVGGAGLVVLS